MIIYKATNKINGMSYIGQTIYSLNNRISRHKCDSLNNRDNMYFHRAIRKYGIDNFDWDIIDKADNIDELNRLEIYYIGWYDTYNNGYNLTLGGKSNVGYKHSEESKRKNSESNKGQVPWNKKFIMVDGRKYSSASEAADFYGLTTGAIYGRVKNDNFDCYYLD